MYSGPYNQITLETKTL